MTPLRFSLTDELLIDAARLHNKGKWPRFIIIYVISAAMIGIVLALASGDYGGQATLEMIAIMVGTALTTSVVLFFFVRFWMIPRRVRKALTHFDPSDLQWEAEWNETHLQVHTGEGHSSIKFARLAGWKLSPTYLLVYRTDDAYYVFPRPAFDSAGGFGTLIDKLKTASVVER